MTEIQIEPKRYRKQLWTIRLGILAVLASLAGSVSLHVKQVGMSAKASTDL